MKAKDLKQAQQRLSNAQEEMQAQMQKAIKNGYIQEEIKGLVTQTADLMAQAKQNKLKQAKLSKKESLGIVDIRHQLGALVENSQGR